MAIGGGDIGEISLFLRADISKLQADIAKATKTLTSQKDIEIAARIKVLGEKDVQATIQAALDKVSKATNTELGKQVAAANKATAAKLVLAQKEAEGRIKAAERASAAEIRTREQAAAKIQRLGVLQTKALAENAKFDGDKLAKSFDTAASGGSRLDKVFAGLDTRLSKFGLNTRAVSILLGAGLATGLAGIIRIAQKVFQSLADLAKAASDLEEAVNKSTVVFGPAADRVEKFASTAAEALGLSKTAALDATGVFGNLFVGLGIPEKAAANLSTALVKLSVDIASLNNVANDEVFSAFQSALAGQAEPLRRFGIFLTELSVKQEAVRLGLIRERQSVLDSIPPLDQKTKVLATYSLAFAQSETARGDFARSEGTLATQSKVLQAKVADLRAELGNKLLPVFQAITQAAIDGADAFSRFADHPVSELINEVNRAAGVTLEGLKVLVGIKPDPSLAKHFKELAEAEKLASKEGITVEEAFKRIEAAESKAASKRSQDQRIKDGIKELKELAEAAGIPKSKLAELTKEFESNARAAFAAGNAYRGAAQTLQEVQEAARLAAEQLAEVKDFTALSRAVADAERNASDAIIQGNQRINDANAGLVRANVEGAKQIADAQRSVTRAVEDGARSVAAAKLDLSRTIRDSNERIIDSEKNLAKVQRESAEKVKEAARNIKDVAKESSKKRIDAENKLKEVTLDAHQRIADSEEKLAEVREKALERVSDAEKKLISVQKDVAKDLENAFDKVKDAIKGVEDAQQDLADAQLESAERIRDAQKELAQVDGRREAFLRSLTRKQREDLKQREAIEAAKKNLDDARKESLKQVTEAEQKVLDAKKKQSEAEQSLVDAQLDAAEKIKKAQEDVVDAQREASKDIAAAVKDRADAIQESNKRVGDAQKDLKSVINDTNKDIKESYKKYADAVKDSNTAIQKATEDNKRVVRDANESIADSQRKLAETIRASDQSIADSKRRLRDTEASVAASIISAQKDVAQAYVDARERIKDARQATVDAKFALLEMVSAAGQTAEQLKLAAEYAERLRDALLEGFNPGKAFAPGIFPGLMAGGAADAGSLHVVGERGPELFIPNRNGQVISNDVLLKLIRALNERQGGRGDNIYVTTNREDPDVVAARVSARQGRRSTR